MKVFILLFFISTSSLYAIGQEELFNGESKLRSCEIAIQLDPTLKDHGPSLKFIDSLKETEVVWIVLDNPTLKTKIPKPRIVYFQTQLKNGDLISCLMPKDRSTKYGGKVMGLYPDWSWIRMFKFYDAKCYFSIMER